jgi:NADH dehydrogenase
MTGIGSVCFLKVMIRSLELTHMDKKKVVIIGGGFAGMNLAKDLTRDERFHVTLVDKNNYNFFPPLLYQVATGFLEASNISYPFRKFFQERDNFRFSLGGLENVRAEKNIVETESGDIAYDFLVLATGTESNYFGMESVRRNAVPMKTVNDALALRNHLLCSFEKATKTGDQLERRKLLTVVVAGAGPTGVEVAGMLAEMNQHIFKLDYPELAGEVASIYLVDALPVVLSPMSKKSQEETLEELRCLGIKVLLEHTVKGYEDGVVTFGNGVTIHTESLIWTAGVTATRIQGLSETSLGRGRRILVDGNNKVLGYDNIFALGDLCLMLADRKFPDGHPQLAQVAIQQGQLVAKNLRTKLESGELKTFAYRDKGSMAVIGVNKAVADLPGFHFKGFVAYFLWLVVHLFSLLRYRNQVKTFYNWMVAFFTRDQSLRFIMSPKPRDNTPA